jgi:hypothetical protein
LAQAAISVARATVAPCAQISITLELACGGEIVGRFVYTGRGTEDVVHRCCRYLILESHNDPLDCLMWLDNHRACGMTTACVSSLGVTLAAAASGPSSCITGLGSGADELGRSGNSTTVGAHGPDGDECGGLDAHALGGDLVGDEALSPGDHGTRELIAAGAGWPSARVGRAVASSTGATS